MQKLKTFICLATLVFLEPRLLHAQQSWLTPNSPAASDYQRRIEEIRKRGDALRRQFDSEYLQEQEQILREWHKGLERRQGELRANIERLSCGSGTYAITSPRCDVPRVTPVRGYYRPSGYSSYFSDDSENCDEAAALERERQEQQEEEDGFAAASGKCGDVTTQRIGNFYYHSDGGVTQKIGNFFYGPDGQVTQKIGSFYYHSDGTTTQKIGNFYYDSDGGVTQKIGNFYYHSGGKPCEEEESEKP